MKAIEQLRKTHREQTEHIAGLPRTGSQLRVFVGHPMTADEVILLLRAQEDTRGKKPMQDASGNLYEWVGIDPPGTRSTPPP
jgi:hypothetical protein